MPYTVKELDSQYYALDWSKWPVPQMPDLPKEPWAGVDAFWKKPVASAPVDTYRTGGLAKNDIKINAHAGGAPWQGTSYGIPFNLVNSKGPLTPVWDLSRPIVWNWFTPKFPIDMVPLVDRNLREGDPNESSDVHWIGFDPVNNLLWESIQLIKTPLNRLRTWGRTEWCSSYDGGGAGISKWDMAKPWDAAGQPWGVVAANVPKFPLVPRWEEILKGRINHALFMAIPNYDKTFVKPARGTDGDLVNFPIRCGERLRLKRSAVEKFPVGTSNRIIAEALFEFGAVICDRNTWNVPFTSARGGCSLTQDSRWTVGDASYPGLSFEVNLSDFEVITA